MSLADISAKVIVTVCHAPLRAVLLVGVDINLHCGARGVCVMPSECKPKAIARHKLMANLFIRQGKRLNVEHCKWHFTNHMWNRCASVSWCLAETEMHNSLGCGNGNSGNSRRQKVTEQWTCIRSE